ncbi:MAG: hypothetical protein WBB47_08250 [Paenisporosarcina sp.]
MVWGSILLWIFGLFIMYLVIFVAVKDAIDKSKVGQIVIMKYGVKEEVVTISDEEIEKELEDVDRNNEKV